jgi:hypothetical protein
VPVEAYKKAAKLRFNVLFDKRIEPPFNGSFCQRKEKKKGKIKPSGN